MGSLGLSALINTYGKSGLVNIQEPTLTWPTTIFVWLPIILPTNTASTTDATSKIDAFVTAYACLKVNKALELLETQVLHFDTGSVLNVCMRRWSICWTYWSGPKEINYFIKSVSAGPKAYTLKSFFRLVDICKAQGFLYYFKNAQILNVELWKDQQLLRNKSYELLHIFPPTVPS